MDYSVFKIYKLTKTTFNEIKLISTKITIIVLFCITFEWIVPVSKSKNS